MAAYFLFDVLSIHDPERMEQYRQRVVATLEPFGGRLVAAGGTTELVEGNWLPNFPVLLEFPDHERARGWYDSPEYREIIELRTGSTRCNAILMNGL